MDIIYDVTLIEVSVDTNDIVIIASVPDYQVDLTVEN